MTLMPFTIMAYDICDAGIYYNIDASTQSVEVTYGDNKYIGDIKIPSDVLHEGVLYAVTSIGERAFYDCVELKSIEIPNSVTTIGGLAFCWCSSLSSVLLPEHLSTIEWFAFGYCQNITSIDIPSSTTNINYGAFSCCNGLVSVVLPEKLDVISQSLFESCDNLTSVSIPEGVSRIEASAFGYCPHLTSVTLPSSVQSIGFSAFVGCTSLCDIYCLSKEVPLGEQEVFDNFLIAFATLHVPASSISLYQDTSPWSEFGQIVPIDEDTEMDIESIFVDDIEEKHFSISGVRMDAMDKGLHLIKRSDGKVKKIFVR